MLVSDADGHGHATFRDLPNYLRPGDMVVVNDSATLPASLPAEGRIGPFRLNLSTRYGPRLWLAEPRWNAARPGPLPLEQGEVIAAAGVATTLLRPYPTIPRLWFVQFDGDVDAAMRTHGEPIRYGYLENRVPLQLYQTLFARQPGSAEMPSAARPFTGRVLQGLIARGVRIATITLHTGVSSLEADQHNPLPIYPEPFRVTAGTAAAINTARAAGGRVIAVGTTVVRALESARLPDGSVRGTAGFTRHVVQPADPPTTFDALLTGLHDAGTTHLSLLHAAAGQARVDEAYALAVANDYLWHEFGDVHLLFRPDLPCNLRFGRSS
jgi:S-adenosylmethionine:tRNA ribosyltransferase-isomerase